MDNEIEIQSLKKIVKVAGIVFIGLLISKLLTYGYRLIAARIGVEEYGLLSLGLAVFGVLTTITVAGLDLGVLRYVAFYNGKKDKERTRSVIVSSLKICLIFSLIFAFLMFFSAEWVSITLFHNAALSVILKMFSFIIPFFSLGMVLLAAIRSFQKIEYSILAKEISENVIKVALTIALVYAGYGLFGAVAGYMIAVVSSFSLAFYFLQKKVFPILKTSVRPIPLGRELFAYSWPLMFTNILNLILSWTDTLMIGYFRTVSEVGIYNVALPTATLMTVIPLALLGLFIPVATELVAKDNRKELEQMYKVTSRWSFFLNFPIFLVMILFSGQILRIMFGAEYIGGASSLIIIVFGYLIYSVFIFSTKILQAIKMTKSILVISVITAVSNVILNFYLIPAYGIVGGAMSISFAFMLHGMLSVILSYRATGMQPITRQYLKAIASGIISVTVAYKLIKALSAVTTIYTLILMLGSVIILYFVLLMLFRGFEKEDIMILRTIEKKFRFRMVGHIIRMIEKFM